MKTTEFITESINTAADTKQLTDFIRWVIKQLHIAAPAPKITISFNHERASGQHHTGAFSPDNGRIWIYVGNRNMVDIFRTVFHELVHYRQNQLGMVSMDKSYPGSAIEAVADMMAGKYIKIYGKSHPEIFQ